MIFTDLSSVSNVFNVSKIKSKNNHVPGSGNMVSIVSHTCLTGNSASVHPSKKRSRCFHVKAVSIEEITLFLRQYLEADIIAEFHTVWLVAGRIEIADKDVFLCQIFDE